MLENLFASQTAWYKDKALSFYAEMMALNTVHHATKLKIEFDWASESKNGYRLIEFMFRLFNSTQDLQRKLRAIRRSAAEVHLPPDQKKNIQTYPNGGTFNQNDKINLHINKQETILCHRNLKPKP